MKILEVSRYKNNFSDHQLPFVTEQGQSLQAAGCHVDYFLIKGNYLKAVRALKTKIREFQPDIVHAHYGLSGITAFALFSIERSEFSFKTVFHRAQPAFSIIAKRILCTSWLLRSKRQMRQCTGSRFSMAPSLYQRISMMS